MLKSFLFFISSERQSLDNAPNDKGFFRVFGDHNHQNLTIAMVVMVKKLYWNKIGMIYKFPHHISKTYPDD